MKKLFYILLLAIIAAGVASPVYAQEGYPVDPIPVEDRCSDSYWMGVSADTCIEYYNKNYPDVVNGCWGLDGNDCVMYYESVIFDGAPLRHAAQDQTVDVPAGGEGPNAAVVIAISFAALLGIAFYLTYKAFWKHR